MGNSYNIEKFNYDYNQSDSISASSESGHGGGASSASGHGGGASSTTEHIDLEVNSDSDMKKIKKYGDNLLKFPSLKFNEKIINPHFEAKLLSSNYEGAVIKSIVYETVYNTILYNIFINSINNDSFFVVSDTVLHNIKKDLFKLATILADIKVKKILELKEYRAIKYKCQKKKCKGCNSCNTANNKIRDYNEQLFKYNEDRNNLIIEMISDGDFRGAILKRDGNLKKIIEDLRQEELLQEKKKREQMQLEFERLERIRIEKMELERLQREERIRQ